jgi:hypothetical protein
MESLIRTSCEEAREHRADPACAGIQPEAGQRDLRYSQDNEGDEIEGREPRKALKNRSNDPGALPAHRLLDIPDQRRRCIFGRPWRKRCPSIEAAIAWKMERKDWFRVRPPWAELGRGTAIGTLAEPEPHIRPVHFRS